jgi:DNA-binding Xre family transcriptional regulator
MILFKIKRKLSRADTTSNSVRTNVPSEICQIMDVRLGDYIYFEYNEDGTITLTKASESE